MRPRRQCSVGKMPPWISRSILPATKLGRASAFQTDTIDPVAPISVPYPESSVHQVAADVKLLLHAGDARFFGPFLVGTIKVLQPAIFLDTFYAAFLDEALQRIGVGEPFLLSASYVSW